MGRRLREVRKSRGITAEQLAARCAAAGVPDITTAVIANIETGRRGTDGRRRRYVTVDELMLFAYVLDIAPVHLLIPTDPAPNELYRPVPDLDVRPDLARAWIRGRRAIGTVEARQYDSQVPAEEFGPRDDRVTAAHMEAEIERLARQHGAQVKVERDDVTGATFIGFEAPDGR